MGGRRVRRPEPKTKQPGCLLQFLVAAIAAVALGYFMGTFIFRHQAEPPKPDVAGQQPAPEKPGTTSSIPPKKETKDQEQAPAGSIRLPELHVFQVQVGAFGQKANAERLASKLSAEGWPVDLVPSGNLIQVRAGLFFGRPAAESFKARVSTNEAQAVVVEKAITRREVSYLAQDKDSYQLAQELVASLLDALTAAEEGRVEEATTEVNELAKTAIDISILNEKKEKLSTTLQNISSNLVEASKAPASQKAAAVSRGISIFVNWYQGLPGAQ